MTDIHIIHNPDRYPRHVSLTHEMFRQGLSDFALWPAIIDDPICRGVSRAHKQIVAWALGAGLPEVTVMEDDVKFPSANGYSYYLKHKPKDFDLYLGGIYRGTIKNDRVKDFSGLHMYTVRAKFYEKFLAADELKHLDTALAGLGDYHVCYPMVAIQYNGYSDVERAKTNFDNLLNDKLIYT